MTSNHSISEEIEKLLENVAEEEGFCHYEIEKHSLVNADGYFGIVTGARLVGKDEDFKDKILNLVVKSAPKSNVLRIDAPLEIIYNREIYVYNTVFPTFSKLESEKCLVRSSFAPKFYKASMAKKNESLILENLKESGYRVHARKTPMNDDHVSLVMAEYGRLHALSFAFRDQNLDEFNKVVGSMDDVFVKFMKKASFVKTMIDMARKAQRELDFSNSNIKTEEVYGDFINGIGSFIDELLESVDDFSVALHGDGSINNMMFKYDDSTNITKPTKVCFIDFQLSRLGPPVLDLAYFFYTCSSKEIINNLDSYLNLYYNSLSSYLLKLGSNPYILFPYHVLQQQWTLYARFGLIMSAPMIHLMLSEKDETIDLLDIAESGTKVVAAFNLKLVCVDAYNDRMKHIISHFAKNNFI